MRHISRAGLLAALAVTAAGQGAILDPRSVAIFVRELQQAVARDDRGVVSALVRYPLTVFAGGVRIPISDAASLRQNYDVVFSPALKALIAQAAVSGRASSGSIASVNIAADFATIGNEAVRIERAGEGLKITRITLPLAAPSAKGAARGGRQGGRQQERLSVDVG